MLGARAMLGMLILSACGGDIGPADAADASTDVATDTAAPTDSAVPTDTSPPVDADAAVPGRTFWISSDGDDLADGSEATPWDSFSHAIAQLAPGDTLLVKAGSVFSRLSYDCLNNSCDGAPCPSGERGRPITIRAETPRAVELSNLEEGIIIRQCSHVVIDGFEAHQRDEMNDAFATIALILDSDHIVLRNSLFHTLNRWVNGHVVFITGSQHVLFEDSEIYDYHRGAVIIGESEHVTARRIYINGRDTPDLPAPAFTCCCPEGADYGMWVNGSFDVTLENVVVERTCAPFTVIGSNDGIMSDRSATATKILGSVALNSRSSGFVGDTYCEDRDPCPALHRVSDLEIVNAVSINSHDGFVMDAVRDALIRNVTAIDSRDDDFDFGVSTANAVVDDASFLVLNALDTGTVGKGYEIENQAEGMILSSNSFGNETDFDPMFPATDHGTADPMLGGCYVYIPDGSPMRGAGAGGEDIGARIVNRYVDGVITAEPLWDPSSGAFPCGAVVDGVNDETTFPGGTCSTVHERLHVGTGGCAIPTP